MSLHKSIWPFPVKKNYIMMGRIDSFYRKCNGVQDQSVDLLYNLFTDQGEDVGWLLRHLLNPESSGIRGELAGISIRGKWVTIRPSSLIEDAYPEDYVVEIDRDELIRLSREWQELIDEKVAPIYIFYKDGKYRVSDTLPEGID